MARDKNEVPLDWTNLTWIVAVHIAALFGIVTFSWKALLLAVLLWWISGSLGIGLGFHRLLTHHGFKCHRWLKKFLVLCGTLAVEGGPIVWVATHRLHHAYSDKDLDPHSARRGFWWAHVGWIFRRDPESGKFENYRHYAKDLVADPFMLYLDRHYILLQVVLGLLLFLMGGWSYVVWGIFVRLVFGWHCTWLVNSAAHKFGYQTYESKDDSRNCWWVALLTWGEGWHNNHHAFPRSARHGLRWWEIDMNWLAIRSLKALGLVWEIRAEDHLRRARTGDPATLAA